MTARRGQSARKPSPARRGSRTDLHNLAVELARFAGQIHAKRGLMLPPRICGDTEVHDLRSSVRCEATPSAYEVCALGCARRNARGQAAVTDAMYFLLIVTFLSVFLYGFANSYGSGVRSQISNEFNTTFATNALKTILYSSTPRDPSQSLQDASTEVDYLLAIIKEDYADNEELGETEMRVFGQTISRILSPISDTVDYVLYIRIPDRKKFVYFYFHTTNFEKDPVKVPGGRFFVYSAVLDEPETQKDESHLKLFCAVGSGYNNDSAGYDDLLRRVNRLLANVGPTSQATSSIKLVKETNAGSLDSFDAQVDLIMWNAVWLGTTNDRTNGLLYGEVPQDLYSEWGCVPAE